MLPPASIVLPSMPQAPLGQRLTGPVDLFQAVLAELRSAGNTPPFRIEHPAADAPPHDEQSSDLATGSAPLDEGAPWASGGMESDDFGQNIEFIQLYPITPPAHGPLRPPPGQPPLDGPPVTPDLASRDPSEPVLTEQIDNVVPPAVSIPDAPMPTATSAAFAIDTAGTESHHIAKSVRGPGAPMADVESTGPTETIALARVEKHVKVDLLAPTSASPPMRDDLGILRPAFPGAPQPAVPPRLLVPLPAPPVVSTSTTPSPAPDSGVLDRPAAPGGQVSGEQRHNFNTLPTALPPTERGSAITLSTVQQPTNGDPVIEVGRLLAPPGPDAKGRTRVSQPDADIAPPRLSRSAQPEPVQLPGNHLSQRTMPTPAEQWLALASDAHPSKPHAVSAPPFAGEVPASTDIAGDASRNTPPLVQATTENLDTQRPREPATSALVPTESRPYDGPQRADTPAVNRPETPKPEISQHIARQLAEATVRTGSDGFELALDPEELGHVRLRLLTQDGASVLMIHAERPETLDLMRRHIGTLEHELRMQGHQSLSLQFSGGSPQGDAGQRRHAHEPPKMIATTAPADAPTLGQPPAARTTQDHLDLRL